MWLSVRLAAQGHWTRRSSMVASTVPTASTTVAVASTAAVAAAAVVEAAEGWGVGLVDLGAAEEEVLRCIPRHQLARRGCRRGSI